MVKETCPDVPVVFGGPHATGDPKGTVSHNEVDFVVVGEGEETLIELVAALSNGKRLDKIDGLAFKKANGEIVLNAPRKPIADVDSIPFPEFGLLPLSKYFEFPEMHGMLKQRKRFMPILTSRGCPFGCIYCHNIFGKRYRPRSPENVIQEILMLYHQYGIREFHIEDDTFNVNLERAKAICDLIARHRLDIAIQFPSGLRADLMDEQLMRKLKQVGTFMIAIGLETASPRIMRLINKRLDIKKVKETVDMAVKNRIKIWGYFMIGFPGETGREMEQTIAFAKALNLHFASFSIVTPFPGPNSLSNLRTKRKYYGASPMEIGLPLIFLQCSFQNWVTTNFMS
jgi:anaerobic magnesium-protoporphyrin IX monomethyl ester cyclase